MNQPEPVSLEMDQFKKALVKFYERESKVPIFFERNYKTSHMQLQVIPIPKKAQRELKEIFMVSFNNYVGILVHTRILNTFSSVIENTE